MALRQVLQGLRHLGQKLDWMIGDGVGKAVNLRVQFWSGRLDTETFEGIDQGMREAVQSVAVLDDAFALHVVENLAHLLGRELVMIEKRDEMRDGALEVDVVLPKRV